MMREIFWLSRLVLAAASMALCLAQTLSAQALGACTVETIAGGATGPAGDGGPALEAELYGPRDVRLGPDGLLYISDSQNSVIRRVTTEGRIETFAGGGDQPVGRDPIPGKQARLSGPGSMTFGPDGTLYFVDGTRILKITPSGQISSFAGRSNVAYRCVSSSSQGRSCQPFDLEGTATDVFLGLDMSIASDRGGNVYVASLWHNVVRKITPDGRLTTVAGTGAAGLSGDGGMATDTELWEPTDVAIDSTGNIYIAEGRGGRLQVRRVLPDGVIETYLKSGLNNPDGTPRQQATVRMGPRIELDAEGTLYWFESGSRNSIRRVSTGVLETVLDSEKVPGVFVTSLFAAGDASEIYLFYGDQVSRYSTQSGSNVLAGVGLRASARGDGGPARDARIGRVEGLATGPNGDVYFVDGGFVRVRVVKSDGTIQKFAGNGELGQTGDGGLATEARFWQPVDVAADTQGNVYIADEIDSRVRRVDAMGMINAFAGKGRSSCIAPCGDGGPAIEAGIVRPQQVEVDRKGNVYVLQDYDSVRRVNTNGIIETVFGSPFGPSRAFIESMAIDGEDNLIVSGSVDGRVGLWRVGPGGSVSPLPGSEGFVGWTEALASDRAGNTFSVGRSGCESASVKRLTSSGTLNTIAGGLWFPQCFGFDGDRGPAGAALFRSITGLALDDAGNLYVGDNSNGRVRRINRADRCAVVERPQIAISGVRHGASFSSDAIAPGTLVSVFGKGLGSDQLTGARLGENGRFTTELGGTRILIDGAPAPMIFSLANQIGGVIPFGAKGGVELFVGRSAHLQVEHRGVLSEPFPIQVADNSPGIFTLNASGSGLGAILNQDLTVNGPLNPAAPGSVIVIYATGGGVTDPPSVDGEITGQVLARPVSPVEVTIGGQPAELLYAGAAPGLVSGVLQANARVPAEPQSLGAVPVRLKIGSFSNDRQNVSVVIGR